MSPIVTTMSGPAGRGRRVKGPPAATGPYERFRPTYTLPYTETDAPFTYNANTGLTEGTVWDTSWHTRSWWQANAVTVRTVKASGGDYTAAQFATALSDAATANDVRVIVVDAGLTITGNFTVPTKSGTAQRTLVCSSTWWAGTWAPTGQRYVDVDTETAQMFTVQASTTNPTLVFEGGASNWAFVGAIIRRVSNTSDVLNIITIGVSTAPSATAISQLPHSHIFQWCWIDGLAHNGTNIVPTRRGLFADGYKLKFINSIATGFAYTGSDSQAIIVNAGAGRIECVDSLLEGASENFNAGGGTPNATWLPSDMVFRRCYFPTRQQWNPASSVFYGGTPIVKNCFELKQGYRVLCEACVFENSWGPEQSGNGLIIKTTNQTNTAFRVETRDVTFLHCLLKKVGRPIAVSNFEYGGGTSNSANTYPINRIEFINLVGVAGTAQEVNSAQTQAINIGGRRDNVRAPGSLVGPLKVRWSTFASRDSAGFGYMFGFNSEHDDTGSTIENCVFDYGAFGAGGDIGVFSATAFATMRIAPRLNALPETPAGRFLRRADFSAVAEQFTAALWSTTSSSPPRPAPTNWFADWANGNYRPHPSATYRGLADGGNNPGADIDFIESVTAGVADAPSFITVEFV